MLMSRLSRSLKVMRRGYISDTEARRMGLHKIQPIPTATLPPHGEYIRSWGRKINPQHLAEILTRMLNSSNRPNIDIGREMALHLRAICQAIVSVQSDEQSPTTTKESP